MFDDLLTESKAAARAGDLDRARRIADCLDAITDNERVAADAWRQELDAIQALQFSPPAGRVLFERTQRLTFDCAFGRTYEEARRNLDLQKQAKRSNTVNRSEPIRQPEKRSFFDFNLAESKAAAKVGQLQRARALVDDLWPIGDDECQIADAWSKELDSLEALKRASPTAFPEDTSQSYEAEQREAALREEDPPVRLSPQTLAFVARTIELQKRMAQESSEALDTNHPPEGLIPPAKLPGGPAKTGGRP